jgi:hypothetical protein
MLIKYQGKLKANF